MRGALRRGRDSTKRRIGLQTGYFRDDASGRSFGIPFAFCDFSRLCREEKFPLLERAAFAVPCAGQARRDSPMPVRSAGSRARATREIAVEFDSQLDQGAIAR